MIRKRLETGDKVDMLVDDSTSAVSLHVTTARTRELGGLVDDAYDQLSGIHIGLAIIERFEACKGKLHQQAAVDKLVQASHPRTSAQYDLDALVAAVAIELAVVKQITAGRTRVLSHARNYYRELRTPTDSRLLHLKHFADKEPFGAIAAMAVTGVRDSLVDQYMRDGTRGDPDNRVFCAQMIGSSILAAQHALSPKPQQAEDL